MKWIICIRGVCCLKNTAYAICQSLLSHLDDFTGLLTQRDILNNAFNVVEKYGFSKLKKREEMTLIKGVMAADTMIIKSGSPLKEVGQYFAEKNAVAFPLSIIIN